MAKKNRRQEVGCDFTVYGTTTKKTAKAHDFKGNVLNWKEISSNEDIAFPVILYYIKINLTHPY